MAWAQHLHEAIPGATLTVVHDGGHFSTLIDRADEILEWLTAPRLAGREGQTGVAAVR